MGKYNQGLYLNGRLSFSTHLGGLVTLLIAAIMISYSVQVFSQFGSVYNLETRVFDLSHFQDAGLYKLGSDENQFIQGLVFYLDQNRFTRCANISLQVVIGASSQSVVLTELGNDRLGDPILCVFMPKEDLEYLKFIEKNKDVEIIKYSAVIKEGLYPMYFRLTEVDTLGLGLGGIRTEISYTKSIISSSGVLTK